jgi:hypothetical protein
LAAARPPRAAAFFVKKMGFPLKNSLKTVQFHGNILLLKNRREHHEKLP